MKILTLAVGLWCTMCIHEILRHKNTEKLTKICFSKNYNSCYLLLLLLLQMFIVIVLIH